MLKLLAIESVEVADVDMCAYGVTTIDDELEGPAKKATKITSHAEEVIKRIAGRCPPVQRARVRTSTFASMKEDPNEHKYTQISLVIKYVKV